MPTRPVFVLPDGLDFELEGDLLNIRFDGDLHLCTTLGRTLGHIEATGDITLDVERVTGTIIAGGRLLVQGEVMADRLSGRNVELRQQKIRCRAISATDTIVIGSASLKVDALVAPTIELDPRASGRVTVIESHNERGATKIKGGFSIADYEDMIGSADEFLAARGLTRLKALRASPSAASARPEVAPKDDIEPIEELHDLEPIVSSGNPQLDARIDEAIQRISACYASVPPPEPVTELCALVGQRDYHVLGTRITDVWNALLAYHQAKGIRPHHRVTHAFNVIHGLVSG